MDDGSPLRPTREHCRRFTSATPAAPGPKTCWSLLQGNRFPPPGPRTAGMCSSCRAAARPAWTSGVYDVQSRTAAPLLASAFDEGWATFSPDGKWIAYVSDENQQPQVYIRSFPDGDVKTQISTSGGAQPQWRRDGRELFYIAPDNALMSVAIQTASGRIGASAPRMLFITDIDQGRTVRNQYAVLCRRPALSRAVRCEPRRLANRRGPELAQPDQEMTSLHSSARHRAHWGTRSPSATYRLDNRRA